MLRTGHVVALVVGVGGVLVGAGGVALAQSAPATPKRPVTDTYPDGTKVSDDYRWLEKVGEPEVQAWAKAQDAAARAVLETLPARAAIHARVVELSGATSVDYLRVLERGAFVFAEKVQPPKNQPFIVLFKSPTELGDERLLVDPNVIDPSGRTAIDWFEPSLDGKRVAVSLSQNGSESGNARIFDTATGAALEDVPRVNSGTSGGSLAWEAGGQGFYYTRHPAPGERPPEDLDFYQQIYHHTIGKPAVADSYALGKDFPKISETVLESAPDGKHVVAVVANGDGGDHSIYLCDAKGVWTRVAADADGVVSARFGKDGRLYLLSIKDAPRGKILAVPVARPNLAAAKVIAPEGDTVMTDFEPTASRLYVRVLEGGPNQLLVYELGGKRLANATLPPVASVEEVEGLGGDDVLINVQTYTEPARWMVLRKDGKLERTPMARRSPVDLSGYEVEREMATSRDGTKVPLTIVHKKGLVPDGQNPTLLTGYGGFAIPMRPHFAGDMALFLEQGGVYVVANLRGGTELGEAWHQGGKLTRKQNVFDDLAACAQRLFDLKVTNPKRLAIRGGSNGGLLMGAAVTQHPELYAAVVAQVGLYDMLRVELGGNGGFNITEFGTVKHPDEMKSLYAYSPYHHVKDGTPYPPILMTTGLFDKRVDPWQSFKMTARLQAADPKGTILLRVNAQGGHGHGASLADRIEETTDIWAFVFKSLGTTYNPQARN